jgi:hypothetical protein
VSIPPKPLADGLSRLAQQRWLEADLPAIGELPEQRVETAPVGQQIAPRIDLAADARSSSIVSNRAHGRPHACSANSFRWPGSRRENLSWST